MLSITENSEYPPTPYTQTPTPNMQDLDKARLLVDCVKRREKLKWSAIRVADAYWKAIDNTADAPRVSRPPSRASTKQPKAPPLPLPPPPPPTRGGAIRTRGNQGVIGSGRRSGRAAAAAARAAMAAIASTEALEDDDQSFNEYESGNEGDGEERENHEQQQLSEAARVAGVAKRETKGGCVEQEQAWTLFSRLPVQGSGRCVATKKKGERKVEHMSGEKGRRAATPRQGLFVYRGQEEEGAVSEGDESEDGSRSEAEAAGGNALDHSRVKVNTRG